MVIRNGFSVKTGKSETVKVCGNCRRVSFGLNREEAEFLKETVQYHGTERVLRWIKTGSVRFPRQMRHPLLSGPSMICNAQRSENQCTIV